MAMFKVCKKQVTTVTKLLVIYLLRAYRLLISPILGNCCRFHPSCSCYAEQAVDIHGVCKGSVLTLVRLLKCHPMHAGGYDPVPQLKEKREK
jgi:putative membrane protein insertion efficiency factor